MTPRMKSIPEPTEDEFAQALDKLIKQHLSDGKDPKALLQQGGLMKNMIKQIVQTCLEAEMETHLGYGKDERAGMSGENRRNGYGTKTLLSEHGDIKLAVPRDRNGEFEPRVVAKHQRRLGGIDEKILALYARGMTVRDIQDELKELYGTEISPTLISNVTDAVMDEVRVWQNRPLDPVYPIVWFDALIVKVRENQRVINKAVYLALAVNAWGQKELLGMWISQNEGAKFWLSILTELKNRGVQDIFIACVDGLTGMCEAIQSAFPKTWVQLCIVHMVRNSVKYVSWKDRKELVSDLKQVYNAATEQGASAALDNFAAKWDKRYPMISKSWRTHWAQITPMFAFPDDIRKVIYTTNAVESVNMTLRKASRNHRIFPNDEAVFKVMYLASQNISKKWTMALRDWRKAMSQFAIEFEGRLPQ
jgi:putative transposase